MQPVISKPSSREVQSLRTALDIVSLIQDFDGATMSELVSQMDIAKSTVYNYLGTLQSMGYVVERNGTYRLGLRFLTHGMAARSALALEEPMQGVLQSVMEAVDLPVWWVVEEQGRGLFVHSSLPTGTSPTFGRVGKRSYLHAHAPGKAILASLSDEAIADVVDVHGLPAYTNETISETETLFETIAAIRERGFATSEDECALGIRSVGIGFSGPDGGNHAIGTFSHVHDVGKRDAEIGSILEHELSSVDELDGIEG
ncbi:MAG: IclR family transcriptional regulator [archaeon]